MSILVTGTAGFIGSNLTEHLLAKGQAVVGLDNFNTFYSPKVKEYNIKDFVGHKNFSLYRIDLLDLEALTNVFEKEKEISAVVHLAALPGVTRSFEEPAFYVRNNIEATINLLETCKKFSVNNFVFASSSSIYGNNETPFVETMSTDFTLAPYPATKKACEVLLYGYSKNFGIKTTILRIFNPNGPRLRPDLAIPLLVKSCLYGYEFPRYWSDQDASLTGRDYCYIGHILESVEYVTQHPFEYEVFNLGNSSPVTLSQLVHAVEEVTGKRSNTVEKPARKGEMQVTYANIDKANKMLGYNPTTPIIQIVQKYFDWFVKQDTWYKEFK